MNDYRQVTDVDLIMVKIMQDADLNNNLRELFKATLVQVDDGFKLSAPSDSFEQAKKYFEHIIKLYITAHSQHERIINEDDIVRLIVANLAAFKDFKVLFNRNATQVHIQGPREKVEMID